MKILSIYIDETGDFGPYNSKTPIYGVSFVLCENLDKCSCYLEKFNKRIKNKKQGDFALHAGPLIRNKGPYEGLNEQEEFPTLYDEYFVIHSMRSEAPNFEFGAWQGFSYETEDGDYRVVKRPELGQTHEILK